MNQSKKVVGRRDYWTVNVHYGEYQDERRHLIENDIDVKDGIKSMFDGIKWFHKFVDEHERTLAFADGNIVYQSVAVVEDEDGNLVNWNDEESDEVVVLHWDRSDLDDETVEEGGKDGLSD